MKKTIGTGLMALVMCSAMVAPVFAADSVAPTPPFMAGPVSAPSQDGKAPSPHMHPAGAEHRGEHRGGRHGGPEGGPFQNLNLTQEQKTQIQAIHQAHRENSRSEVEKVLTPEQRTQLQKNIAEHSDKFGPGVRPLAPPAE